MNDVVSPWAQDELDRRLANLQARVVEACTAVGRDPSTVAILPVTKTHGAWAPAWAAGAGLGAVGENRVPEAEEKRPQAPAGLRWELIGHLQSNKAKRAVAIFDRIQSVDSPELVRRLGRLAAEAGRVLPVLLQVNAGDDPAKFGVTGADAAAHLLEAALAAPSLRVEGLMTIAPFTDDPEVARACFAHLRAIRDQLESAFDTPLPELSMGMTGDLEAAVAEGSTMLRVGTALFGARP